MTKKRLNTLKHSSKKKDFKKLMDRLTGGRNTQKKRKITKVIEEKRMLKSTKHTESVKLVAEIKITNLNIFYFLFFILIKYLTV